MSLKAKVGGDFELAPAGNHIGRCIRIIDIGTIETVFEGKSLWQPKIKLGFELPLEKMEDSRPFSVWSELTLTMNKKGNLRPLLEGWRGKSFTDEEAEDFDILKLLDKTCMINVVHKEGYANINSIAQVPKGTKCPDPINEVYVFELSNFSLDTFEKLTEKTREKIMRSKEWEAMNNPSKKEKEVNDFPEDAGPGEEDDIPF